MRRLPHALLAAVAVPLLLTGCDIVGGEANGQRLDTQMIHPGGVVLQVLSTRIGDMRTEVSIRVLNGRDREIQLNNGNEQSYLLTGEGEKLLLVAPPANPSLSIPAGQTIDASLIFTGEPSGDAAILILNERSRADNVNTSSPRFEVSLPLAGAGRGTPPEQSALSAMRPNPASQLQPRSATGSGLAGAEQGVSELRVVEALRTELGAVDTERGTMVSLSGDVTFDFDEATIRQGARSTLDSLAELILASGDGTITIEGHTDSHGQSAYNQRLSELRAEAVSTYLVSKGVPASRLETEGLGATRPVVPNIRPDGSDDEPGRQRNRRVEIIFPESVQPTRSGSQSRLEPAG